jgi:hypothetical protein
MNSVQVFGTIPPGLRDPLLAEYQLIVQNFMERKWRPSELSGGRFCEIVFTILDGHAKKAFANAPEKPANFVQASRNLENNAHEPRSFQILIPRLLPALYEIRNNRNVGHVGGEVDPNHMDAGVVLAAVNWILAELIRVFHQLPIGDAQKLIDTLVERRIPVVWQAGEMRRVLDTSLKLMDQILLLIASCATPPRVDDLFEWTGYDNRGYFNRTLRDLHVARFAELSGDESVIQILPPGVKHVEEVLLPKYM